MIKSVYEGLRVMFGSNVSNNNYQIWAKTEYGRDWLYAYNFMVDNNGQLPHLPNQQKAVNDNLKGQVNDHINY